MDFFIPKLFFINKAYILLSHTVAILNLASVSAVK